MATDCIPQVTFQFSDHRKPVVARFDQAQASTDGGAVLLKALDDRLRLTDQVAACLVDRRNSAHRARSAAPTDLRPGLWV